MRKIIPILTLALACCAGLNTLNHPAVSVQGTRFVDAQGRYIILHGTSVVNKNPNRNYLGPETEEDFAAMRDWGFNVVRLGVIWDGLEPQPGMYDEDYLKGIDQRIEWARQNHLYVFLDMHQDLYSVQFSDGAPEWATLTDGQPHISDSPVWSDAYFSSPAVQRAWDHFWDNSPAPDSVSLQDHYAAAWAHLAQRYAADTTVIAYDMMNEPFMGSEAVQIFPAMLSAGAQVLAQQNPNAPSVEELAAKWMTVQGRAEILGLLGDINIYKQVIDATQPIYNQFEQDKLMPMYQRVARAIRKIDKNKILLLETTMGSNMGVYTAIEPLIDESGARDPQQAYAPHGYDLVTDTPFVNSPNFERVELIFSHHHETAQRLSLPMLVGEWGAYGRHQKTLDAAAQVSRLFEKFLASDAYWDYTSDLAELDHFHALNRPYPQRIAGELLDYAFHLNAKIFTCRWNEDKAVSAPTIIYIPDWLSFIENKIELQPAGAVQKISVRNGSKNILLAIPPTGETIKRQLTIHFE